MNSILFSLLVLTGCGTSTKQNMFRLSSPFIDLGGEPVPTNSPGPLFGPVLGGVVGVVSGGFLGISIGTFVAATSVGSVLGPFFSVFLSGVVGGVSGACAGVHAFALRTVASVPPPGPRQGFI